jgi:hypothetical protein
MNMEFIQTNKKEVRDLLDKYHYIGSQCADPCFVFSWIHDGVPFAAALFAPPAAFAWGKNALELVRLVRSEEAGPPLTKFLSQCVHAIRTTRYNLLVSYADPSVGHHGGIYQAASWIYVGLSTQKFCYIHKMTGKRSSQRSFDQSNYVRDEWNRVKTCRKHKYVLPLTKKLRLHWMGKAMPYPKTVQEPIGNLV